MRRERPVLGVSAEPEARDVLSSLGSIAGELIAGPPSCAHRSWSRRDGGAARGHAGGRGVRLRCGQGRDPAGRLRPRPRPHGRRAGPARRASARARGAAVRPERGRGHGRQVGKMAGAARHRQVRRRGPAPARDRLGRLPPLAASPDPPSRLRGARAAGDGANARAAAAHREPAHEPAVHDPHRLFAAAVPGDAGLAHGKDDDAFSICRAASR